MAVLLFQKLPLILIIIFYLPQTLKRFAIFSEAFPDLQMSIRKVTKVSALIIRNRSYPGFKI